jgi:phospholipid transport system substrate-binding protein
MTWRLRVIQAAAAAVILAAPVGIAQADAAGSNPAAIVQMFYNRVSATMKDGDRLGFTGRRDQLETAVRGAFDLPRMTRLAVGPRWASLSGQDQSELISAFGDYSAATYASRFTHDGGETFAVSPSVTTTADGTIVHTKLLRPNNEPVRIDYLMKQGASGDWRIEDVYLSGTISELATRRSEFTSVLDRGGAAALVDALRKKAAG